MTEREFLSRVHYCEDRFPLFPAADEQQRRARQIAQIGRKLDRATELLIRQALQNKAGRPRRLDPPMTSGAGLTPGQMAGQFRQYEERAARACAEAKAAYDARNPHKKDGPGR